jgi:hypothetical protein
MNNKFYTIVCHDTAMPVNLTNGETNLVSIMASNDLSSAELKKMLTLKKQLGIVSYGVRITSQALDKTYPNLMYTWLGAVTKKEAESSTYVKDITTVVYNKEQTHDEETHFYNEETQMGAYSERGSY